MHLAFKFRPNISHKKLEMIKELSWHTSKLYNTVNYLIKNEDDVKPIYSKLDKEYKDNWHCDFLHSHNRQHCFKQLAKDWKSFFNSLESYKKNPAKYQGKPRSPKFKYLDNNPNEVIYTKQAYKIEDDFIKFSLSKKFKQKYGVDYLKFELPLAIQSYINMDQLQQIRLKFDRTSKDWYLLIIYKTSTKDNSLNDNIMGIDLGLDNLATLTFKDEPDCYIINGKTIKSKNSYFNKEISRLSSIRMKQVGSERFKDTKQIRKLRIKRRNYINDYLHKASRKIIDLALEHNVSKIVIGDLKEIKQGNTQKSFVQVPIQKLVEKIEYKAELENIEIIKVNEAYTSGCSAVDREKLSPKTYDKSRRITRGLFKTNDDILINADQNGSLNILRKYLEDECTLNPIEQVRDNGFVVHPKRIRIA